MKQKLILLLTFFMTGILSAKAQVTIGSDENPHSAAVLDLQSSKKGLKLPSVVLNEDKTVFVLDPETDKATAKGMLVYNTSDDNVYVWTGSTWKLLAADYSCPDPIQPNEIVFTELASEINLNDTFTASVTAELGMTYTWSVPQGLSIQGISSTNQIMLQAIASGSYDLSSISVTTTNECGNSSPIRYGTGNLTVRVCGEKPAQPGAITFSANELNLNSTFTASVDNVAGATSYVWTLPSGLTGTSNSNSITITGAVSEIYAGSSISVKAVNPCGTSTARNGSSTIVVTDCASMTVGTKSYKTCVYDGTRWMVENSKEGSPSSKMYNGDSSKATYYYSWDKASNACPSGWRVPTKTDVSNLVASYDKLYQKGFLYDEWRSNSANNTGYYYTVSGSYYDWGYTGRWWSATEGVFFENNGPTLQGPSSVRNEFWLPVRCVKN